MLVFFFFFRKIRPQRIFGIFGILEIGFRALSETLVDGQVNQLGSEKERQNFQPQGFRCEVAVSFRREVIFLRIFLKIDSER